MWMIRQYPGNLRVAKCPRAVISCKLHKRQAESAQGLNSGDEIDCVSAAPTAYAGYIGKQYPRNDATKMANELMSRRAALAAREVTK